MPKQKRSNDWGFPRWRAYGGARGAARVRLCERDGCDRPGDRPAPKAPNSPERWYFCETHAAEYNKNWNYFAGLDPEEAARRAADEEQGASGFRHSAHWKWAGPGDGSRSRDEMRALDALELDSGAGFKDVKAAYRRLAKANHPDVKPGDEEAASRFQTVQAAYDVLRKSEERRNGKA
ncbi:MAG: J domain-containing protein [Sphingomonas sp.]|nr:J domain-containing protein [Sphingomonas sp.]